MDYTAKIIHLKKKKYEESIDDLSSIIPNSNSIERGDRSNIMIYVKVKVIIYEVIYPVKEKSKERF